MAMLLLHNLNLLPKRIHSKISLISVMLEESLIFAKLSALDLVINGYAHKANTLHEDRLVDQKRLKELETMQDITFSQISLLPSNQG